MHSLTRGKGRLANNSAFSFFFWFCFCLFVFKTGFLCVALESVLELALVDQAGLKLTKIHMPMPPKC